MFRTLNRAVKFFFLLLVLAGLGLLYQQRHIFEPVWVLADILQNRSGEKIQTSEELSGTVIQVATGDTFQIKTGPGQIYSTRLTGLLAPQYARFQDPASRELFQKSRDQLSHLTLSNTVQVRLTYLGLNSSGLGIAYLDSTNINVALLEAGMAELNRDYIKNLPICDQYAMIRAEQKAQSQNLGIWKDSSEKRLSSARSSSKLRR